MISCNVIPSAPALDSDSPRTARCGAGVPVHFLGLLVRHERAGSLLRRQHSADFQFPISPNHRIRINREIDRELAHRGELIARPQTAGRDAAEHLVDNLPVDRHAAAQVNFTNWNRWSDWICHIPVLVY